MKDLHSHVLYGIDDGSKSLEESIKIIKRAYKEGITEMMVTPHYMYNTKYNANNKTKKELFDSLVNKVNEEKIPIKLYLGNETFITHNYLSLIKSNEIMTLNNSRYLLLEFPLNNKLKNTRDIIFTLVMNGYVPILAHPERYLMFQKNPEMIEEYLQMGVLLQGNYKSLLGKYGSKAKKTLKYFLKNDYISFLGSDVHHDTPFPMKKFMRKLRWIIKDSNIIDDILYKNFDKVVANEEISIKR